jgi:hypothetical protein
MQVFIEVCVVLVFCMLAIFARMNCALAHMVLGVQQRIRHCKRDLSFPSEMALDFDSERQPRLPTAVPLYCSLHVHLRIR